MLVGPDGMSGSWQAGVWIFHGLFRNAFPNEQEGLRIQDNTISGFHAGVLVQQFVPPYPVRIHDLDVRDNQIACDPTAGTNAFQQPPVGVSLMNFGSNTILDDVEIEGNDYTDCDLTHDALGNVTNVVTE